MNLLKGSWMLKLASLVVALLTYYYIYKEVDSTGKNNAVDASYKLIKLTAKNLPVKVRLETSPPDGYRLVEDQVTASPTQVTVIGPEALLEDALNAETAIVDVSEYTKTVTRRVPLESVAGIHLVGDPYEVEVTMPIEKIPVPEKPAESAATPGAEAPPANSA